MTILGLKPGMAVTFERLSTGEVLLRPVGRTSKPRQSIFAKLRGSGHRENDNEEILALTRGG